MLRVGLTGNIASGKSAVAEIWRRLGVPIIDADDLSRRVVEPGSEALARVVERFGSGVLDPDGALDRAALRRRVFDDAGERAALERILHPEIARLRRDEEKQLAREGARVIVHVVPLLFETGLEAELDLVVLVDAREPLRLRRIVETRGLSEEEAQRMIAAQTPAEGKRVRAALVIDNNGTLAELERNALEAWRVIERRIG
jgi:dephospho-CoA kinase